MNFRRYHRVPALVCTVGVSLFAFAALRAQEPAKSKDDAPVRKELEELRAKSSKKCAARAHEGL